jgi:tetratricopeptide (TPR) repeat protein
MYRAARVYSFFFILVTFFFGFINTVAQGEEVNGEGVEQINRKAMELVAEKRYPEAIVLFEQVIERQPTFAPAHLNLGSAYLLSGQPNTALGHIKRGLELDPDSPIGNNQIAVVYNRLGKLDLAIEHLKKTVQLKPDYALGQFNLGAAYLANNRLKPAAAALEKAARLDPNSNDVKLYLGVTYARQSRFSEALAQVKAVTKKQPDHYMANLTLCTVYLMANDRQSALDIYQSFKSVNVPLADEMFRNIFSGKVIVAPK